MLIPEGWPPNAFLSPGFRVGDFIYTAGNVGHDPVTGEVAKGIQKQTEQALINIEAILKAGDATLKDVIKMIFFFTDIKDKKEADEVYKKFFNEPRPARSGIIVKALANPDLLVEIEAIAYKPE